MYRFQITVTTSVGESIGLIGSTSELGQWNVTKGVRLQTSSDLYPLWWTEVEIAPQPANEPKLEYKYVRITKNGRVEWETGRNNRWIPAESEPQLSTLIIDDGFFGQIQPYPYGYYQEPIAKMSVSPEDRGRKILVTGSSVALGCSAWLLKGWAWHLEQALRQRYGHQLVNRSILGGKIATLIEYFPKILAAENPDLVVISLSLGNEGLAYCPPHQRQAVQQRFEAGLQQLIRMTQKIGVPLILGGVYPHGDYSLEHHSILRETRERMLSFGIPVLDWLPALYDGAGRWKKGLSFDVAHPNSQGHRLMYEAINLSLFNIERHRVGGEQQIYPQQGEMEIYRDPKGFSIFSHPLKKHLRIINPSQHTYTITPSWQELQTILQSTARLKQGIYIERNSPSHRYSFFSVQEEGTIGTFLDVPPSSKLEYIPIPDFLASKSLPILFHDEHLKIFQEKEHLLGVINESPHEYNIHPMWKEVSSTLKKMTSGVYEDPSHPDTPFRTLMISPDGLESRVKIPSRSLIYFQYKCRLSEIKRVAIIPLGDRCAVRMLLYKMEYDGPAFPFDLTRTTNLADVADMIASNFCEMWNPNLLHYNHDERRIYHGKWSGLSFAHEVEDTDDPLHDLTPAFERMRIRYTARSERFWYTLHKCDQVIFVRTGAFNRENVSDLVSILKAKCQGKPFRLLLFFPQSSEEILGIPDVLHYSLEFNPDQMYENLEYWMDCTQVMREILGAVGVSSKNLFWCPPNVPKPLLSI